MGMYGDIGATGLSVTGGLWEMGTTLIGRALAQGDIDEANRIYQQIANSIDAEELPKFNEMLAQEVPEATKVIGAGEGRQAQSAALQKLSSFVDQYGLDSQARAANEEALMAADQRAAGNRGALMQGYARKGMQGSGSELASMLQENQASANQGRQSSLDIAGQARQRALDALGKQAAIGGQMRGQDIDVESKNSAAEQARNEFNAKMRYAAAGANNENMEQDFMNRMAKKKALNAAKAQVAQRRLAGAQQTQGDWAAGGRAVNMLHQGAAEGSQEMPF